MKKIFLILLLIPLLILACKPKSQADKSKMKDSDIQKPSADIIYEKYISVFENAKDKYNYNEKDYLIIINAKEQKMYLFKNGKTLKEYIISSGKAGEGNIEGSGQTPLGFHKIVEKIGDKAAIGTIFVGKKNTGKISPIYTDKTDIKDDPVVTRILSLDGLEAGYNKGGNVDSFKRAIYIHGTHEEGLLGTKTSHGCIRMYNKEVISLFDTVSNDTIVYITN